MGGRGCAEHPGIELSGSVLFVYTAGKLLCVDCCRSGPSEFSCERGADSIRDVMQAYAPTSQERYPGVILSSSRHTEEKPRNPFQLTVSSHSISRSHAEHIINASLIEELSFFKS